MLSITETIETGMSLDVAFVGDAWPALLVKDILEANALPELSFCFVGIEFDDAEELIATTPLVVFPAAIPISIASIMPSIAETIEAGISSNVAIVGDTWPALSVKTVSIQTFPVAQLTVSALVKVETTLGNKVPTGAGISSTIPPVPNTTAS